MKAQDLLRRKLRALICLMTLFCLNLNLSAQKKFVLKDIQTGQEFVKKDSATAVKFLDSLAENRYYFTKITSVKKDGSQTEIVFDKGRNYNQGYVKFSESLHQYQKVQSEIFIKNIDSLKKTIIENFTQEGYAFSRIKTIYKGMKNGDPILELSANLGSQRVVNGFVVKGYEKVPKRFVRNLEKNFSGRPYSPLILKKIDEELRGNPYIVSERAPQTLFTKDSTQIYLLLQKKKTNTFDGVVGFGNDRTEKISFTGSIDVNFRNLLNSFETINLHWQRNQEKSQNLDFLVDLPYMLGSNVGFNFETNIMRQDSAFANAKIRPAIYYNFGRHKLGLRGSIETSTVNMTNTFTKNFNKKSIAIWYRFQAPSEVDLFQFKTNIVADVGIGNVNYSDENISSKQNNFILTAEHNFHIVNRHYLNLKGEGAALFSELEIPTNEMLRFGGWNSFRGFNENAILADFFYYGKMEYRYLLGTVAYFDVFAQYGKLFNNTLNLRPNLYSGGIGFSFNLPIGLMTFQISNGSQENTGFRFNNTKVHWGLMTRF